jgi:hypothetical protein
MTITIIQRLWKEGNKKKNLSWGCFWPQGCERKAATIIFYCEHACGHMAVKERQKFIVKVLVTMWHSEISDCVLSPQAYLH